MFRDPELGSALKLIASQGASAFYKGAIAKAILKTSVRLGGKFTAADLAEFQAEWVEPISTEYHGWKVYELPPSGQGIAALQMLNLFSQFPLASYAPRGAEELHLQIEAQKLAYADLQRFIADPRFSKAPVNGLLSMDYARDRAKLISTEKARCDVQPGTPPVVHGDTIYLSVVDRDGNIVSLIQSVYQHFGSGVVVDNYGFALQNRGGLFDLDENHPNALAPRKRPFHTIIPAFMEKGDVHIGIGIMGGLNQAQAHAQFVSNIVDHGMSIQMAMEAPRFTKEDIWRLRRVDREPLSDGRPPGADGARPRVGSAGRFLQQHGRRPGGSARFVQGCELWGIGSAEGRGSGAGNAAGYWMQPISDQLSAASQGAAGPRRPSTGRVPRAIGRNGNTNGPPINTDKKSLFDPHVYPRSSAAHFLSETGAAARAQSMGNWTRAPRSSSAQQLGQEKRMGAPGRGSLVDFSEVNSLV